MIWFSCTFLHFALPKLYKAGGITIRCCKDIDTALLEEAIRPLVQQPSERVVIQVGLVKLFCKKKRLGGLKKRLKSSFSKDYIKNSRPYMEIINNAHLEHFATPTRMRAAVIYRKFGIVRSIFILTDYLEGYTNGEEYLEKNPRDYIFVVNGAFSLLEKLLNARILHLDFRLGNIMIDKRRKRFCAIDHEYTYTGKILNPDAVLGFQIGFLYQHTLKKWITEETYCKLAKKKFPEAFCSPAFNHAYECCSDVNTHSSQRMNILTTIRRQANTE